MSKSKAAKLVSKARVFAKANQKEQLARFHEQTKQAADAQKKCDEAAQALVDFAAENFQ